MNRSVIEEMEGMRSHSGDSTDDGLIDGHCIVGGVISVLGMHKGFTPLLQDPKLQLLIRITTETIIRVWC
jgi:hypothetical protein